MMGIGWEWIAGALAAVIVAFLIGRISAGSDARTDLSGMPPGMAPRPAPPPPSPIAGPADGAMPLPSVPEAERRAIFRELAAGNKIAAIKLLREASGLGLREAKDLVEAVERQSPR